MRSFLQLAGTLIVAAVIPVAAARGQVRLTVDAGKTGAPISKYVYGQFAEHLGRSIYGGLWAEMVEDRKFAHEITEQYSPFDLANDSYGKPAAFTYLKNSPWKIIGPQNSVTMEKAGAYVGEWSPVIHLAGDGTEAGISQGNEPYNGAAGFLAVERGKKYVGHIVLAREGEVGSVAVRLGNPNHSSGLKQFSVERVIGTVGKHWQSYALEFSDLPDCDQVTLSISRQGQGELSYRGDLSDAGRQRQGVACRHGRGGEEAFTPAAAVAGREFRLGVQLAGRDRSGSRQARAAGQSGVEEHRTQRRGHPRVHGTVRNDRRRAVRGAEHGQGWRGRGGGGSR